MGNILGGGGGGGLLGGGSGGGGGFLQNLLGGLPDPLGVGKMLGITKDESQMQQAPQGPAPMPPGMQFMQPDQQSGVSGVPQSFGSSPMSPTGFGIGGGGRR
jgi:hypothetical protein